jgi:glycerate dehydrogenase
MKHNVKHIVITDGYLLNPGDLSWENILTLGECQFYDRTPPELVIERCQHADIVITNKTLLMREQILGLPRLQYIGVTATGYNNVDIATAHEKNIIVTNVPNYGTASVAQHTFALLLEATNHVGLYQQPIHANDWVTSKNFCFWLKPMIELDQLTFGIIGFGAIGQQVANIARSFGMNVLINTRSVKHNADSGFKFVDKNTLFKNSDVISLNCPLTVDTHKLINTDTLNLMKPNAILINTSRGALIDESALALALQKNKILAAVLDVLEQEPPCADNPLLTLENCIITPHNAWASYAARQRLLNIAIENLNAHLCGKPQNMV